MECPFLQESFFFESYREQPALKARCGKPGNNVPMRPRYKPGTKNLLTALPAQEALAKGQFLPVQAINILWREVEHQMGGVVARSELVSDTPPDRFGQAFNTPNISHLRSKHAEQKSNKCQKWPFCLRQISNNQKTAIKCSDLPNLGFSKILKVRFYGELKLIDKDGFECRYIVLLIEQ